MVAVLFGGFLPSEFSLLLSNNVLSLLSNLLLLNQLRDLLCVIWVGTQSLVFNLFVNFGCLLVKDLFLCVSLLDFLGD